MIPLIRNANVYHPCLSDALALATKNPSLKNRGRSKRSLNAKYDQILGSVKGRATSLFAKKPNSERGRDGETFSGSSSILSPRSYRMGSKVKLASLASETVGFSGLPARTVLKVLLQTEMYPPQTPKWGDIFQFDLCSPHYIATAPRI